MTKMFAFAIVMFVGLAACTSKKPEEGKEPLQQPPPAAPAPGSGAATAPGTSAGSSAPGGSAGSAAPTTPEAAPGGAAGAGSAPPPAPVACATQVALHCDAGQTDGCTGGLTSVHLCVATGAKPGEPCAQGAALTCPTGQIDACTYTPPYASNHVCVVVPRPTP